MNIKNNIKKYMFVLTPLIMVSQSGEALLPTNANDIQEKEDLARDIHRLLSPDPGTADSREPIEAKRGSSIYQLLFSWQMRARHELAMSRFSVVQTYEEKRQALAEEGIEEQVERIERAEQALKKQSSKSQKERRDALDDLIKGCQEEEKRYEEEADFDKRAFDFVLKVASQSTAYKNEKQFQECLKKSLSGSSQGSLSEEGENEVFLIRVLCKNFETIWYEAMGKADTQQPPFHWGEQVDVLLTKMQTELSVPLDECTDPYVVLRGPASRDVSGPDPHINEMEATEPEVNEGSVARIERAFRLIDDVLSDSSAWKDIEKGSTSLIPAHKSKLKAAFLKDNFCVLKRALQGRVEEERVKKAQLLEERKTRIYQEQWQAIHEMEDKTTNMALLLQNFKESLLKRHRELSKPFEDALRESMEYFDGITEEDFLVRFGITQ